MTNTRHHSVQKETGLEEPKMSFYIKQVLPQLRRFNSCTPALTPVMLVGGWSLTERMRRGVVRTKQEDSGEKKEEGIHPTFATFQLKAGHTTQSVHVVTCSWEGGYWR